MYPSSQSRIKKDRRKSQLKQAMLLGASALALTAWNSPGFAQTADQSADESNNEVDQIVITGSRLKRDGFDMPSPVMVIDSQLIQDSALVSISDVLVRNPAIAVGVSVQNVATAGGNAGGNFTNLRGLGIQRSLTVINGKRRVPGSTQSSAVDLSVIPPSMVDRVEILTGGAGAVYGADAVTGVTNIILKTDFTGLRVSGQVGLPQQGGGGDSQQISIHGGASFDGGRGNVNAAVSYERSGFLDGLDRKFAREGRASQFRTNLFNTSGNDGIPDRIILNSPVVTFNFPESGGFGLTRRDADGNALNVNNEIITFDPETGVASDPFVFDFFTADPELRLIMNDVSQRCTLENAILCSGGGTSLGFVGGFNDVRATGGDGFNFAKYQTLRAGFERVSGLLRTDYEIFDDINLYVQMDATLNESLAKFQAPFNVETPTGGFASISLTRDNPLLPDSVTALMDERGIGTLFINRTHDDLGRRETTTDRTTFNVLAGFNGTMFDGWDWDTFFQYGRTDLTSLQTGVVFNERLVQAFDAIVGPDGTPVCRDETARQAGCQPLKALGRNDVSLDPNSPLADQSFRNWLYHDPISKSKVEQILIGAEVTGDAFELPAGPVGIAAGFEYRDETIKFRDDGARVAGLLLLNNNGIPPTDGSIGVWELYGETLVPILSDLPLIHHLEVEGAFRYSEYDTVGGTTSWKIGGSWAPVDDLRLRVTRSRSVRAPTITDLFAPPSPGVAFPTDPCSSVNLDSGSATRRANCAALGIPDTFLDPNIITKTTFTGGNPELDPETSNSLTIGAVFTPDFIPGLRMSVDYWDIDLEGAISGLNIQDIVNNCVDLPTTDNVFCPLITRRADFELDVIRNLLFNIGELTAKGIDFQAAYSGEMSQFFDNIPGSFRISMLGTYLDELNSLVDPLDPDSLIIGAGEGGSPKWRFNVNASYYTGPWSFSWFINYIGGANTDNQPPTDETNLIAPRIPSQIYNNLAINYQVNDRYSLRAGVNNIMNASPPNHPFTSQGNGGAGALFDNNGRFFFFGGTATF